ncbi:hypothetical protein JD969_11255 [Planctomycetota bacterium]|nr:hypothetical protein JD969_11255 [Planctomycetota bacterium]
MQTQSTKRKTIIQTIIALFTILLVLATTVIIYLYPLLQQRIETQDQLRARLTPNDMTLITDFANNQLGKDRNQLANFPPLPIKLKDLNFTGWDPIFDINNTTIAVVLPLHAGHFHNGFLITSPNTSPQSLNFPFTTTHWQDNLYYYTDPVN